MRRGTRTPKAVNCPSCGALAGNSCKNITRSNGDGKGGWEYCLPYDRKRKYCSARWDKFKFGVEAFFDTEESAAESGLLAPDFHETVTTTGLLEDTPGSAALTAAEKLRAYRAAMAVS